MCFVFQTFSGVVLTDGIGFNNIAAAMVSVIQILTYAAWSYMMYRFTDTYGIYAIIYSVLCIIIGCYFVVSHVNMSAFWYLCTGIIQTCTSGPMQTLKKRLDLRFASAAP
jgi:tryptophan-rich sensory protein